MQITVMYSVILHGLNTHSSQFVHSFLSARVAPETRSTLRVNFSSQRPFFPSQGASLLFPFSISTDTSSATSRTEVVFWASDIVTVSPCVVPAFSSLSLIIDFFLRFRPSQSNSLAKENAACVHRTRQYSSRPDTVLNPSCFIATRVSFVPLFTLLQSPSH